MKRVYSLYEAKAKLSAIIRAVRERGDTVVVSYRGEPVAEIRPIEAAGSAVERRIAELEARGVLVASETAEIQLPEKVARRGGALNRFLAERDS